MFYLTLILVIWLLCALYTYGVTFAYFQGEYPKLDKASDRQFALAYSLFGPLTAIIATFLSGFLKHGWRLR